MRSSLLVAGGRRTWRAIKRGPPLGSPVKARSVSNHDAIMMCRAIVRGLSARVASKRGAAADRRACAVRGRIASLCGPPSGSPSVTSSRDGACLSTAPRKPVLAVRYASALDLSRVSAVASAPRGPCTGCAQRSALMRGRLLTAPSVSHYKGKHQHPQRVSSAYRPQRRSK